MPTNKHRIYIGAYDGSPDELAIIEECKTKLDLLQGVTHNTFLVSKTQDEYELANKLANIYSLITSKELKKGIKCIINLYNEMKDTYNDQKDQS